MITKRFGMLIGMTLMGFTFGPMSAVFIATWLATQYGVGWVDLYLFIAASLSFIAILIMRETRDASLDSGARTDAVR